MAQARFSLSDGRPRVVGCFGSAEDLRQAPAAALDEACDVVEIRLDLVWEPTGGGLTMPWRELQSGLPRLFTARRPDEGGAGGLGAAERVGMLERVLDEAACIDLEVASIAEAGALLRELANRELPWIGSFHDFEKLPEDAVLADAARRARDAGASGFKVAAMLRAPADLARLADFQLADHGLPVASMGMGPMAAVSRLLCAQCGSVLNYGYLGTTATAPGQWSAALLKQTLASLVALPGTPGRPAERQGPPGPASPFIHHPGSGPPGGSLPPIHC